MVVYDTRLTERPLHVLQHDRMAVTTEGLGVASAVWAHESPMLVTGGDDSLIRVWDMRRGGSSPEYCTAHSCQCSGNPLIALKGHGAPVSSIAISTDDHTIVSGDDGSKVSKASRSSL